jgi:histidyl-tRNA synthetase
MKIEARYVVMVGMMEASTGIYQVRDMLEWTQEEVKKDDLIAYITKKIGDNSLDFYCPAKDLIVK